MGDCNFLTTYRGTAPIQTPPPKVASNQFYVSHRGSKTQGRRRGAAKRQPTAPPAEDRGKDGKSSGDKAARRGSYRPQRRTRTAGESAGRQRGGKSSDRGHRRMRLGLGAVTVRGSRSAGTPRRLPRRRKQRRNASLSAPHTHHWELRNGGGGGGEPGGRARRSQSPPPASFEPAPKTAESGVRGGRGRTLDRGGPRSMRNPQPIGAGGGRRRRRAGTQGRTAREELPLLPQVQTKQGRERARRRAPEEESARRAGG